MNIFYGYSKPNSGLVIIISSGGNQYTQLQLELCEVPEHYTQKVAEHDGGMNFIQERQSSYLIRKETVHVDNIHLYDQHTWAWSIGSTKSMWAINQLALVQHPFIKAAQLQLHLRVPSISELKDRHVFITADSGTNIVKAI